jgi:hypothetical protein
MVHGVSGRSGQCVARHVVMGHKFVAGYVTILNLPPGEPRVLELPLRINIAERVIAVSVAV